MRQSNVNIGLATIDGTDFDDHPAQGIRVLAAAESGHRTHAESMRYPARQPKRIVVTRTVGNGPTPSDRTWSKPCVLHSAFRRVLWASNIGCHRGPIQRGVFP